MLNHVSCLAKKQYVSFNRCDYEAGETEASDVTAVTLNQPGPEGRQILVSMLAVTLSQ